jgi:predicted SnoaL-like aldol condensation-catalyzing enzyme
MSSFLAVVGQKCCKCPHWKYSNIRLRIKFKLRSAHQIMPSGAQEQNKEVVRQCIEAWDRHDTERMEQLISSSNYSFHSPEMSSPINWNATKQFLTAFWSAFPDVSHKIEDMVAEGDKVAVRVINTVLTKVNSWAYRQHTAN